MDEDHVLRVCGPVCDGEHGDEDDGHHLNDVDDDAEGRRPGHAVECDKARRRGQGDRDEHLDRDGKGDAELPGDVADEHREHARHQPRIDPVVKMGEPPDHKLVDAREDRELLGGHERLFGKIVGAPGPGFRVQGRELRVGNRRQQRQNQRERESGEHIHGRGPARDGLRRLHLKREPQKRPRRNQRHGVHGDPGQSERLFHLNLLRHFKDPSLVDTARKPFPPDAERASLPVSQTS